MKHGRMLLSVSIAILAVITTMGCGGGGTEVEDTAVPFGNRSIIVIAIDGLRADSLGVFGGQIGTPNFDRLAAQSYHFRWAFAQAANPATSFAALMTGLYPTTSGVVAAGDRLPDEAATLAEVLSNAGITTAAFIEGEPGGDDFGLAQGFDEFSMSSTAGSDAGQWLANRSEGEFLLVLRGWSVGLDFAPESVGAEAPEGFFDRVQQVLASDVADQPLAFEAADLEYLEVLYRKRVQAADTALGELMARLDGLGLTDRAILVVAGTSGLDLEQHGPRGSLSLHSTVTRVPLFIRVPLDRGPELVDKIVELIDVMPTLLDLSEVAVPQGVQGASLVPIMDGSGRPPYIAFSESPHMGGQRAVAMGGMRMLTSVEDGDVLLYDLDADPDELTDIASGASDRVDVLKRHLEAWSKMVSVSSLDPALRTEEELDDETLEQLKSLGYIQ